MNRLFKINESERKRILNMHTSATSRQYLNEQEEVTPEVRFKNIVNGIKGATSGPGTSEKELVNYIDVIKPEEFDLFIEKMEKENLGPGSSKGLGKLLDSELGSGDLPTYQSIKNAFDKNSSKYTITATIGNNTVSNIQIVPKNESNSSGEEISNKRSNSLTQTDQLLKKGAKSNEVITIKNILINNNQYWDKVNELDIKMEDDTYDGKMVGLIAYFQAKEGLGVDGIVGPETREALNKLPQKN